MSKASELYLRAKRRCTFTDDKQSEDWIANEIHRLENIEQELYELATEKASAIKTHEQRLEYIRAKLAKVQAKCPHEFHRGTAECDPQCKICGFSEPEYRKS